MLCGGKILTFLDMFNIYSVSISLNLLIQKYTQYSWLSVKRVYQPNRQSWTIVFDNVLTLKPLQIDIESSSLNLVTQLIYIFNHPIVEHFSIIFYSSHYLYVSNIKRSFLLIKKKSRKLFVENRKNIGTNWIYFVFIKSNLKFQDNKLKYGSKWFGSNWFEINIKSQ